MQASQAHVHIMHADAVMTAGLRTILADAAEFQVSTGASAQGAQVIVTDYEAGIAAARLGPQDRFSPAPRVLIVTQLDKEWEVRTAMDSGVHGYLLQNCQADELVKAVRTLMQGMRYLSESVTRCVADSLSRETLTGRETDVLQLLAKGCCNKSIARELGIGVGTVKTHVKGLMSKLEATARTHAVVVATQRGLIGPGQRISGAIHNRAVNGFHSNALQ